MDPAARLGGLYTVASQAEIEARMVLAELVAYQANEACHGPGPKCKRSCSDCDLTRAKGQPPSFMDSQ